MSRVITKIGDVFSVNINGSKKFFQFIAIDGLQLNSDVIRVFKTTYKEYENPEITTIIADKVEFYTHCVIKLGVKLGLWHKVGKSEVIDDIDVIFRATNDYGHKIGEEPIKVSDNWYVWKVNDKTYTKVGKLKEEYTKAELGLVISPFDLLERIKTGNFNFLRFPD